MSKQKEFRRAIECQDCRYYQKWFKEMEGLCHGDCCANPVTLPVAEDRMACTIYYSYMKKEKNLSKPEPKSDQVVFGEEALSYLDHAIKRWRVRKLEKEDEEEKLVAACYVDAFQSVRTSFFGECLPEEVE